MSSELDTCETAWHDCAAQIDMIIDCQNKHKAKDLSQKEGKRHE